MGKGMKTKKTGSEKGAEASPTSKKPKAVMTKKQERTPSSKTATPTGALKKEKTIAKPQPSTSEVVSAKHTNTPTKPERTPSSKTAIPTGGPKKGKTIPKPQPPTSEEVYTKISKLAYELYERRGWHQGQDLSDWLDAERQVFAQEPLVTTLDH